MILILLKLPNPYFLIHLVSSLKNVWKSSKTVYDIMCVCKKCSNQVWLTYSLFRLFVFTARCYASAVQTMALCLSVRPSQVGVLLKRVNVASHKQHHTIAQGLWFPDAKDLREILLGSPPTRAPNAGGVGQNRRLLTNSRLYLENRTR